MGQLIYTSDGHVSVVLSRRNRARFAASDLLSGTDYEVREAFEGMEAYAGTYQVDPAVGLVTHHLTVCRYPNWENAVQVRYFQIEGDRLTLSTPPIAVRGREWVYALLWARMA